MMLTMLMLTLSLQCLNGDVEQCKIHLEGLELMIKLRGKDWTAGLDLIILRILIWLVLSYSMFTYDDSILTSTPTGLISAIH